MQKFEAIQKLSPIEFRRLTGVRVAIVEPRELWRSPNSKFYLDSVLEPKLVFSNEPNFYHLRDNAITG